MLQEVPLENAVLMLAMFSNAKDRGLQRVRYTELKRGMILNFVLCTCLK